MKKFMVYYWKYKNDDYQDFEKVIEGKNFDDAFTKFRENNPTVKIRCINEIV
jgi:hypothetical protein